MIEAAAADGIEVKVAFRSQVHNRVDNSIHNYPNTSRCCPPSVKTSPQFKGEARDFLRAQSVTSCPLDRACSALVSEQAASWWLTMYRRYKSLHSGRAAQLKRQRHGIVIGHRRHSDVELIQAH